MNIGIIKDLLRKVVSNQESQSDVLKELTEKVDALLGVKVVKVSDASKASQEAKASQK